MKQINLSPLHSRIEDEIIVKEAVLIPQEFYQNSDIINLKTTTLEGKIFIKEDDEGNSADYFIGIISGQMQIPDSVSLESVDYPFLIEYDDYIPKNCIKNENMLDIFEFLWENIVLEVPLQFTKVRDLSKFHGDGWRLVSEDDLEKENNPFRDLLKDFEEE